MYLFAFATYYLLGTCIAWPAERDPEQGGHIEGDIVILPEEDGLPPPSIFNAIWDKSFLWKVENGNEEENVLYYDIIEEDYTEEQISLIEFGAADLQNSTMVNGEICVEIRRFDSSDPASNPENWVRVYKGSGCSSLLGRRLPSQPLSLANGCVSRHGTIMHEFLHALGFYHEQSRGDRDDFVLVNFTNIEPGFESNFDKLVENETIDHLGTPYDYGSVMHYPRDAFAVDPDYDTITPVPDPDVEIGQRIELSELDIERVQILYGCLSPEESVYHEGLRKEDLYKPVYQE